MASDSRTLLSVLVALVILFASQVFASPAASSARAGEVVKEVVKLVPAGAASVCKDLGIEGQLVNGKWLCLSLDFTKKSEQLSTLQVLQTSLDVAQKNDPSAKYLYKMTGSLNHGLRVKSVKLVKN